MRAGTILVASIFLVVAGGCSSTAGRPEGLEMPGLRIARGDGARRSANVNIQGGLSVLLQAELTNSSDTDLFLDKIEVQSVGRGALIVPNTVIPLHLEVPGDNVVNFERWIATYTESTIAGQRGPVTLRIAAYFTTKNGKRFREFYTLEF